MPSVVINATSARDGGGLRFAEDLLPRLSARLEAHDVRTHVMSPGDIGGSSAILRRLQTDVVGRRRSRGADLVVNVGNAAFAAVPTTQWVMVRNRLLIDPPVGAKLGGAFQAWRAALVHSLIVSQRWLVPSYTMATLLESFRMKLHLPTRQIDTVPHGVDPSRFRVHHHKPYAVLYPAVPAPHKNFGVLLRAIERLTDTGQRVELTLTLTADELRTVSDWRPREGVLPAWLRCVGRVDRSVLDVLYATHGVLAFPSVCESFGLPLVEAHAAGLAVVATDLDVFREVGGGWADLVDGSDEACWAAALARAFDQTGPTSGGTASIRTWDDAAGTYAALIVDALAERA